VGLVQQVLDEGLHSQDLYQSGLDDAAYPGTGHCLVWFYEYQHGVLPRILNESWGCSHVAFEVYGHIVDIGYSRGLEVYESKEYQNLLPPKTLSLTLPLKLHNQNPNPKRLLEPLVFGTRVEKMWSLVDLCWPRESLRLLGLPLNCLYLTQWCLHSCGFRFPLARNPYDLFYTLLEVKHRLTLWCPLTSQASKASQAKG